MSVEWRNFGVVAGVFYLWRFGITLRLYGPKVERWRGSCFTCLRLWPFVVLWADSTAAHP